MLRIADNELLMVTRPWDATIKGRTIRIRKGPGAVAFEAVLHPPHGIAIRSIDMLHRGKRLRLDSFGLSVVIDGRPSISLPNYALVLDGALIIGEAGSRLEGPSALVPYPSARFLRLANGGRIEQLARELLAPTIYVTTYRSERHPPPEDALLPMEGAPKNKLRYRLFCEVCNLTVVGYVDLDKPRTKVVPSGLLCESCSATPVDGWCVQVPGNPRFMVATSRGECLEYAQKYLLEHSGSVLVAHPEPPQGLLDIYLVEGGRVVRIGCQ
jgi:hypothetical protein